MGGRKKKVIEKSTKKRDAKNEQKQGQGGSSPE